MSSDAGAAMASNSNQHDPGQQANVEPAGAATLMSSFFPSPPASFSNYTSANIALAKRLIAHPDYDARLASDTTPTWQEQQRSILGQLNVASEVITSVQDVDLRTLVEPPDVSLIEEQGHWMAFGQVWPVHESLPSLQEMSVKQLYPDSSYTSAAGRRAALQSLLHTLLLTYLQLLSILLKGPPSLQAEQKAMQQEQDRLRQEYEDRQQRGQETAPIPEEQSQDHQPIATEADRALDHIRLCAINIHHLCNEWRPIQARETLKLLMRNQMEDRRIRTEQLRKASQQAGDQLASLKTMLKGKQRGSSETAVQPETKPIATAVDFEEQDPRRETDKSRAIKQVARQRMLNLLVDLDAG